MSDAISFEEHWDRTHQFDPPAIFDSLREERPLARMVYPDGHVGWIATSHELVRKVLSDPRFSHNLENFHFPVTRFGEPAVGSSPEIPGMFIHMDPPNHTRYRRLLTAEFTARRANRLTSRVEAVAAEQIAVMREHGGPVDLVANFAEPLVLRVLSEMVGLPYEERDRYAHAPAVLHDPDSTQEEVGAAFAQLTPFIVEVVEGKRKQPGDDLISRLVADGELTTEEVCNIVTLLLFAGYETTENALAVGVFALLHHADQLAALRADPSKLDAAVEELLRYITINQYEMYRTALEDIELDGELVKKGTPSRCRCLRPTATRPNSGARRSWTSIATPRATWRSASASTSAWARTWRASNCAPACRLSSRRSPTSGWPLPSMRCRSGSRVPSSR